MPGARISEGERVTLRTVESEDVPFLQRASANPEIRYPIGNPVRNREAIDVPTDDGSEAVLVCLDDEGGPGPPDEGEYRPIGSVHVDGLDYKRPGLAYWLVPEIHGQGYGTEAVGLVVDYVFRQHDVPAVGAGAYDYNDASRALLESLGFVEEGRRRKYMFVDGAHRDMVQYGLLREEWREQE